MIDRMSNGGKPLSKTVSAKSSPLSTTPILILGSGDRPNVRETAEQLTGVIEQYARIVLADFEFAADLRDVTADLAIVFGGDGSILRAAKQMGHNQIPVLGVNLGKLGFLAALLPDELMDVLPEVCSDKRRVVEHLMFNCSVVRDGSVIAQQLGLNEVAILGGPPFSILNVDLYVDAELATTYSCDGLIVSTPVGSTAHSLSAGGPILRKNLQAFVISPISPHTLTVRPVVDAAEHIYEIRVHQPNPATSVVVDGTVLAGLTAADRVRVERAEPRFKMVEVGGHTYYRTLREKLGWRGHFRNEEPS
jgi:NAD+ kinase